MSSEESWGFAAALGVVAALIWLLYWWDQRRIDQAIQRKHPKPVPPPPSPVPVVRKMSFEALERIREARPPNLMTPFEWALIDEKMASVRLESHQLSIGTLCIIGIIASSIRYPDWWFLSVPLSYIFYRYATKPAAESHKRSVERVEALS